MIVGAAEGLIISVITQPCLLIPGISRHRNRGDVVLVFHGRLYRGFEEGKTPPRPRSRLRLQCTVNGDLGVCAMPAAA